MQSQNSRHVLFLQGTSGLGGSKRSLLDTLKVLRNTRYHPIVACPEKGWLTEQLEKLQIPYVLVPFNAWRKWLERSRVAPSIRNMWLTALSPWDFDIVHSNEIWWTPHAVLLADHLKVPAVVHFRDGRHNLKKAKQYWLEKADVILTVSTDLRKQFISEPELYSRTRVLFNGHEEMALPDPQTARAVFHLEPEELALGNVGRLSAVKNQRLLLRAMGELKRQKRVPEFKILFAGDADPSYRALMEQDIGRFDLQEEVLFLGLIHDMGTFFSAVDLVVHCSHQEGLTRVLPEAMLARKAIVATETGGIRDAIPEEQFGTVVPANSESALEDEIERLSKNPALRHRLADRAYERAQAVFGFPAHRDNIVAVYDDLVDTDLTRGRSSCQRLPG